VDFTKTSKEVQDKVAVSQDDFALSYDQEKGQPLERIPQSLLHPPH
jgi:hypothetical protein